MSRTKGNARKSQQMAYIPKRVIYSEFPEDGIYGVTARHALEAAIDGMLPAYHLVSSPVKLYEYTRGAPDPLTKEFKKWHGITVRVPLGVLYTLNFYTEHCFSDHDGKPEAVLIEGPLGLPDMRPEVPICDFYLLWPEGDPVTFDRDRLFFLREDLECLANGANLTAHDRNATSAAAGQPVIEIGKPSHLLAVAALLELLKAPVEHTRPNGMNQSAIKSAILEKFPWRGLKDRNLDEIFAAANKAKEDTQ